MLFYYGVFSTTVSYKVWVVMSIKNINRTGKNTEDDDQNYQVSGALLYKWLVEKARNGNTGVKENMIKMYKIMYGLKKINVCCQSKYQNQGDPVKLVGRQSKQYIRNPTSKRAKLNCGITT